jgi:hypothetical protein
MHLLLSILLIALCTQAHSTQQSPDTVFVDGVEKQTFSFPLSSRTDTELNERRARCISPGPSANWRGYTATWMIVSNELFLLAIAPSTCQDTKSSTFATIFPDAQAPIRATWFSGEIVFEVEPYVPEPCGYSPVCPTGYDIVTFKSGKKISSRYQPRQK